MNEDYNPFAGKDATERKEVWKRLLAGIDRSAIINQEKQYPPTQAAYNRLLREGEDLITFHMRLARFGFKHGWRGGSPWGAAAFIEGERLVGAFNSFDFGRRAILDFSQLPRDENGNISPE